MLDETPEEFELRKENALLNQKTFLVVLFFDDPIIDVKAEQMKVQAELNRMPCISEFYCYARSQFKGFKGRILHQVIE